MPESEIPPALLVAKALIDMAEEPGHPFECPNCGTILPITVDKVGVGVVVDRVGVSVSRQDNATAICSECGVLEAFGHPVTLVPKEGSRRYIYRLSEGLITDGQGRPVLPDATR